MFPPKWQRVQHKLRSSQVHPYRDTGSQSPITMSGFLPAIPSVLSALITSTVSDGYGIVSSYLVPGGPQDLPRLVTHYQTWVLKL